MTAKDDNKLALLSGVSLVNTFIQLAPGVMPLIERAMQSGETHISMAEVEAAADEAGVDLDDLHAAIAARRKRDAAGDKSA